MNRPVLLVLHREQSSPGRVGRLLEQKGYTLDLRRPPLGDRLPASLDGHSGAIVFGGPMSANDADPWLREETDWIGVPLREGRPFLGICLGAQLLARHLGAPVSARDDGRVEIGYWPIRPTALGRALGLWPERVYHWHREGFGLAAGMERLAEGEVFENQAVRHGAAFGLQFHPEVSFQTMKRWAQSAPQKLGAPGAQQLAQQRQQGGRHDRAGKAWLSAFLDRWLAQRA
ncbi:MAG TPA: glutamine amidotransferase [Burkholderiaceae bacterium]|nr:glutamine amidotransferase [Burkholderiaceae bacterium]